MPNLQKNIAYNFFKSTLIQFKFFNFEDKFQITIILLVYFKYMLCFIKMLVISLTDEEKLNIKEVIRFYSPADKSHFIHELCKSSNQ